MWEEWVLDATMGVKDGMACFVPIEKDGSLVLGMNMIGSCPGKRVGVVHLDGQEAVATLQNVVRFPNPCTRCGRCCREEVCRAGEAVYKTSVAPCPGLKMDGAVASCGLLELCDAEDRAAFTLIMGFGVGCDAEPIDESNPSRQPPAPGRV